MNRHLTPVDISNIPEMLRLAEEVKQTKQPRVLTRDNETVAVLMPVGTAVAPKKKREKTKADYEAFKRAAGSWKDVDTDTLGVVLGGIPVSQTGCPCGRPRVVRSPRSS